jgi:hypothetical protein
MAYEAIQTPQLSTATNKKEGRMFHLLFAPVIVLIVLFAIVVRILTAPFRMHRWHRHRWHGGGWRGYGYPHPYGRSLLAILVIVALERIFGRRYY